MTKYYGIRAAGWLVYGMCPIATQGGYRTRRCLQRTPLGRFSKVELSTTKMVPVVLIRNYTSSESSRRDVSNTDLFGTDTISSCGDFDHRPWRIGPGGCDILVHRRVRLMWCFLHIIVLTIAVSS